MKFIFSLIFFFSFELFAAVNMKLELPVQKYQLKNGLTVLLLEDHTVPMISYHTWYRVGSRNESPGVTGAAHMLEHMMFKGAKKYDGKEFWKILNENGMQNNAFTTYDYTGFYQTLPSSKLELMMQMEVDRMSSLLLRDKDLQSEREVVKEERRWRTDNNPSGALREVLMNTVFKEDPYGWPVIGSMDDINHYTTEKLRYFYEKFYIPNNAVLVLVGDFKTDEAKNMIEKYYGNLQAKEVPHQVLSIEKEQTEPRQAVVKKNVQSAQVAVVFPTVPQGHSDMYPLDLLSHILGNGSSSRLYKDIVYKKQDAISVYAYNMTMKEHGLFTIGASLKPGDKYQGVVRDIEGIVYSLQNKKITEKELEKAKVQVMRDFVHGLTTMDGKAQSLASSEIVTGSYLNLFEDINLYQKVTLADLERVNKKYIQKMRQNTIVLEPEGVTK